MLITQHLVIPGSNLMVNHLQLQRQSLIYMVVSFFCFPEPSPDLSKFIPIPLQLLAPVNTLRCYLVILKHTNITTCQYKI